MTILFTHQSCLLHDVPAGHPENPSRLKVLESAFAADEFKCLDRREAPLCKIESIALMHSQSYIEDVTKVIFEIPMVHGSSRHATVFCGGG